MTGAVGGSGITGPTFTCTSGAALVEATTDGLEAMPVNALAGRLDEDAAIIEFMIPHTRVKNVSCCSF